MPKFSIVIPTYNRAGLLPFAVKSVLQQTFEDFEIVISNGGSTDNTRDVVAEFEDPRIRYFESDVRLPVGDNYQNGLNNAHGDYITFLSDDDAYTPNLLERVYETISKNHAEVVGYQYCRYYHDDLYDFELDIPKNSLLVAPFDRTTAKFSASEALEQVLALHALSERPVDARFICPYLSNATYRRDIFDSLRKKRTNLFDMVPADIYLAAAVFYLADSYHCLDEPLLVWSNWEGNATATAQRAENKVSEHYKRLLNGKSLEHTPLKFPLALNCGANAVLEAVNDLGENSTKIDWCAYFVKTFENFSYLQSVGVDVAGEKEEFMDVLSSQPSETQAAVRSQIGSPKARSKAFLNSKMPSVAAKLRRMVGHGASGQMKVIEGSERGFSNVLEASRFVQ